MIAQSRDMTPTQRDEFLGHFVEHDGTSKSLLGLAVMGGGFSEGIDLVGKRLIGVFVVGVGLPSMSFRRDLIKNHFKEKLGQGFSYAYQFPGVTRVLQSAGRVIRTMNDRGIVVLIDQRFKRRDYKATFPSWWQPEMLVSNRECIKAMEEFWDQNETLPTKGL